MAQSPYQYQETPVFNALVPKEGPKTVPVRLDFSAASSYTLDLQSLQSRGVFSFIQTMYVDNSANSKTVSFQFGVTNQVLNVTPFTQGYYPVLCPNPPKIICASAGSVVVNVQLINVPMSPEQWYTSGQFVFDTNSYLKTTDVALDAIIASGALTVAVENIGNGDTLRHQFNGNATYTGTLAAGGTTATIVTGAQGFFITALDIQVSADASKTAGAAINFQVKDGTTIIAQNVMYIPATAITTWVGAFPALHFEGLNYNSPNTASNLTLVLSAALTAGTVSYTAFGGITQTIG